MASRKDVASLAGVSPASVSYYINSSGYVSKETGEKIQQAIDVLGYTPNQIARSLKVKDSKQFLFFCNEIRNPFFAEIVYHATMKAKENGYTTMFSCVVDDDEYVRKMFSYQVSGVFAPNNKIKAEIIEEMVKKGVPIVLLTGINLPSLASEVTQIEIDYKSISMDIVNHLKEQGYCKTMCLSGAKSEKIGEIDIKTQEFINAYNIGEVSVAYKVRSYEDAHNFVVNSFTKENHPDSFYCTNDSVAIGVLKGLNELDIKVGDVGIIGFDNTNNANVTFPGITSVDIGVEEIGSIAIELLMKKINKEPTANYVIKPKLIKRNSSLKMK